MTDQDITLSGELAEPLGSIVLGASNICDTPSDLSIERALVAYFATRPSIECLIGGRYYPRRVAKANKQWPAITYYRDNADHEHDLQGSAGVVWVTVNLDIWSPRYEDVSQVAEAIRQELQGFSGWIGPVKVGSIVLDEDDDTEEDPKDGSNIIWYSRSLDYRIGYYESIPSL